VNREYTVARGLKEQLTPPGHGDRPVEFGIEGVAGALPHTPARGGVGSHLEDSFGQLCTVSHADAAAAIVPPNEPRDLAGAISDE
jgi:hypothetical protein